MSTISLKDRLAQRKRELENTANRPQGTSNPATLTNPVLSDSSSTRSGMPVIPTGQLDDHPAYPGLSLGGPKTPSVRSAGLREYLESRRVPSSSRSIAPSQSASRITGMSSSDVQAMVSELQLTRDAIKEMKEREERNAKENKEIRSLLKKLLAEKSKDK